MALEYTNYVRITFSDGAVLGDPESLIPEWIKRLDEEGNKNGFDTRYDRESFCFENYGEVFAFETRGGPGHLAAITLMRLCPGSRAELTWFSEDDIDCGEKEYEEQDQGA